MRCYFLRLYKSNESMKDKDITPPIPQGTEGGTYLPSYWVLPSPLRSSSLWYDFNRDLVLFSERFHRLTFQSQEVYNAKSENAFRKCQCFFYSRLLKPEVLYLYIQLTVPWLQAKNKPVFFEKNSHKYIQA